jgi:hypothetical protein
MAGAYCQYCGRRCFLLRVVIVAGVVVWSGHMATCERGMARDRDAIGIDYTRAHNPAENGRHCTGPCCNTRPEVTHG